MPQPGQVDLEALMHAVPDGGRGSSMSGGATRARTELDVSPLRGPQPRTGTIPVRDPRFY